MSDPEAKPGPRDGSRPLMCVLGGVALGLLVALIVTLINIDMGPYGVIPYLLGGFALGTVAAFVFRRRRGAPATGRDVR